MAIVPLNYTPPAYTTTNVLYGVGILFTAPPLTAVPGDAYLGYGTSWTGLGWNYIGGTLDGCTLTFAPTTQNILIEEQPTPVGVAVSHRGPDGHVQPVRGNAEQRVAGVG